MAAVYWVGADGNAYLKTSSGVTKYTGISNAGNAGFEGLANGVMGQSVQANRIADPNPSPTPAPTSPNGGGGGGSGAAPVDKSNDIALQLAGLGAVDQQTSSGIAAIDRALGSLTGQYDTETAANEGTYKTQSDTNQGNLQKNKQTAFVNAAQGRQGLFGTLSSLGALNGSGIDLANQAVKKGADDDLSGASDTYDTNQTGLNTSIDTYRQEDKRRRENANTAAGNAKTNVQNESAKNRMSFLSNLANDYAAMGNGDQARTYTEQAASLYPQVAATSVPDSNLAYSGASFTPGTLANYIAGDTTQVQVSPTSGTTGVPGLIAAPAKKKQLQPA